MLPFTRPLTPEGPLRRTRRAYSLVIDPLLRIHMDLTALAQQFSGRKFGELVLHQCRQSNLARTIAALQGTIEELPPAARPCVESWIDKMNPAALDADFWRMDCGDVFLDVCLRARQELEGFIHHPSDDHVFNMFQIILLNFAYAAHKDPKSKAFVQKSVGVGFFGRLFG